MYPRRKRGYVQPHTHARTLEYHFIIGVFRQNLHLPLGFFFFSTLRNIQLHVTGSHVVMVTSVISMATLGVGRPVSLLICGALTEKRPEPQSNISQRHPSRPKSLPH